MFLSNFFVFNKYINNSNKKRYCSSNKKLPDLIRSRSGFNPSEGSTLPDTVSDISQNERNINRANYSKALHDRAGISSAYNPLLNKQVTDPVSKDIEALGPKFEQCTNKEEAQELYNSSKEVLMNAFNATAASNRQDLHDSLKTCEAKAESKSMLNLLKSEAIKSYSDVEKGNVENLSQLVSELNFSASNFRGYQNLELQRNSEQSDEASSSDVESVEEITTSNIRKQDSSDVVQDTFDTSDYYED